MEEESAGEKNEAREIQQMAFPDPVRGGVAWGELAKPYRKSFTYATSCHSCCLTLLRLETQRALLISCINAMLHAQPSSRRCTRVVSPDEGGVLSRFRKR